MNPRFNWLKIWISLSILLFLFSQVVGSAQIQNVPVVPNDSVVTAKVLEYSILNSILERIEPEQVLYSLRILVISSQSVNGKMNFTQSKVDQVIKVYSKDMLSVILFDNIIKANVSFCGNERGGKYWIRSVKAIEEMPEKDTALTSAWSDEKQIRETLRYVAESYRTENMELLEQSVSQNSSFYSNIVQTARTTFAHYRDIELTFKDIKIDFHSWDKNHASVTLREILTMSQGGEDGRRIEESMDIIELKKENSRWKITYWYKDTWMKDLPQQSEKKER